MDILSRIRLKGFRLAMDDFGTGYSSFNHFNKFEVDRVKIDRTFVDKINVPTFLVCQEAKFGRGVSGTRG